MKMNLCFDRAKKKIRVHKYIIIIVLVDFFIFKLIKDCFVVENGVINIYMVFLGFVLVKIS
jgi:hypothetical protein